MKTVNIIIAFCLGLFFGYIFLPYGSKHIKPPAFTEINADEKKEQQIDADLVGRYEAVGKQNDSLKRKLLSVNSRLAGIKNNLSVQQQKESGLLSEMKKDTSLRKDSLLVDSLCSEQSLIVLTTDSLMRTYETKTLSLQRMIGLRDTQIVICNRSYGELKDLAKEQIERERKLSDDLNTAIKAQRRKVVQNRVLLIGMMFVSGVAATLYMKSKQ